MLCPALLEAKMSNQAEQARGVAHGDSPSQKRIQHPQTRHAAFGLFDKIALGITGIATGLLTNAAIEATKQHNPASQSPISQARPLEPDPKRDNPPDGILIPEGVRGDSSAPSVFKVFLPHAPNKAPDNLVLTAEQQLERFIERTEVVDKVEQVRNGKTYSVETRAVPTASLKVTVKPELKNEVARLVAQDGERNRFTKAEIVVTQPTADIRAEIAPGVRARYTSDVWDYNTQQYVRVGYLAIQQINNNLTFFFAPGNNLPLDNPEFMARANWGISVFFLQMTVSGGDPLANWVGNTEHTELLKKIPFSLVSS